MGFIDKMENTGSSQMFQDLYDCTNNEAKILSVAPFMANIIAQILEDEKSNVKRQTVKELQLEASLLDIDGRSKMNRAELVLAIAEREELFAKAFDHSCFVKRD